MTEDSKEPRTLQMRTLQMRIVQLVVPEDPAKEEYCLQYRSPFCEGKWVTVPVVSTTDPEMYRVSTTDPEIYRWVKEGQDV